MHITHTGSKTCLIMLLVPRPRQHTDAQHSAHKDCVKIFSDCDKEYMYMFANMSWWLEGHNCPHQLDRPQ
jgi:hypothetical protein